jgi:hypothetical protein
LLVTLRGDYNGDGKKDLLMRTGDGELSIFYGKGKRSIEDDAGETVKIPSTEGYRFIECYPDHLNGDDRSDLFFHYYTWERDKDKIVILLSRSGSSGGPGK